MPVFLTCHLRSDSSELLFPLDWPLMKSSLKLKFHAVLAITHLCSIRFLYSLYPL